MCVSVCVSVCVCVSVRLCVYMRARVHMQACMSHMHAYACHGVMGGGGGGREAERGVETQGQRGERWGNPGSQPTNPLAAVSAYASLSLPPSLPL